MKAKRKKQPAAAPKPEAGGLLGMELDPRPCIELEQWQNRGGPLVGLVDLLPRLLELYGGAATVQFHRGTSNQCEAIIRPSQPVTHNPEKFLYKPSKK